MRWGGVWGTGVILALSAALTTPAIAEVAEPAEAWFGESDRTFAVHPAANRPPEAGNQAVGDFDGDGAEDLLFNPWRGSGPPAYRVWWGGDRTAGDDTTGGPMQDYRSRWCSSPITMATPSTM